MQHSLLAAAAALSCLLPVTAQDPVPADAPKPADDHATWEADYDVALAKAKKAGKDLLVDFTGSDWCGWCIRLHEEVFDHEEFWKPASEKFVFVALDFPNGEEAKAKVPNPERNEELKNLHGIQGFPTILLINTDGDVFGRTGYREGGPVPYVEHLNEISKQGKMDLAKVREIVAKAAKAEGDARTALIGEAAMALAAMNSESPGVVTLAELVREGLAIESLERKCVEALLAVGQIDESLRASVTKLDPKNESGLLEKCVAAVCQAVASREDVVAASAEIDKLFELAIVDKELGAMLFTNGAFWNERFLQDHEKAVKFAKKALTFEPHERAKQMLDQIIGG
ncbi:MAG: thioredoxin family protein [Planctomycetes bacterium]|nr:thioredoxin family protein [Planctomycetota bacterium]